MDRHLGRTGFWGAAVVALIVATLPVAWSQEVTSLKPERTPDGSSPSDGIFVNTQLLRDAQDSLIQVFWRGKTSTEHSAGFAVSDRMFASVRPGANLLEDVIMRIGGDDHEGRVVLVDAKSGLVLLESNQSAPKSAIQPLPLGTSRQFFVGDALFALTLDEKGRVSRCLLGMMVGRDRKVNGSRLPVAYLRAQVPDTTPIGGLPILESSGKVIGIDLGISLDPKGEFHVLPVEVIAKLVSDLESFGKREDAWIGVTFNTGTTTPKVVSVRPDSPGERAGILPGDIVVQFAGARIDTLDDLADTCYCLTPGVETEIHLLRGITSVKRTMKPVSLANKPGGEGEGAPIP